MAHVPLRPPSLLFRGVPGLTAGPGSVPPALRASPGLIVPAIR